MLHFKVQNSKIFWGGAQPFPRRHPIWEDDTPSPNPTSLGASILAPSALAPRPPGRNPGYAYAPIIPGQSYPTGSLGPCPAPSFKGPSCGWEYFLLTVLLNSIACHLSIILLNCAKVHFSCISCFQTHTPNLALKGEGRRGGGRAEGNGDLEGELEENIGG
jgi:hypothetical protein